ncbi:restriction endonuclease subunit S [Pseudomonas sp. P66]|uniref:Restriction endonuclease subunit S n=1 Tax=Pseudomonas arcuscaelestis TaxID=2710591 RepID=A0ABS2BX24_9PSED|nr:restriction endonuclease subunit S [Pseudomonas arcuscaelestis]MBM5458177.1 restriction endonuclease subunit S [Pseudomonas arcuscaelestis]
MAVKAGYKKTEVGVIPDDWDVSTVGAEFEIKLGKMLDSEKNVGVPKPYLGNKSVQWGRIDLSDLPTVPMTRADLEKYRLRDGDLLVCEGGDVGRAALWNSPLEECYYQKALHRLRPLRGFDSRLMVELLRQWSDRGLLANYVTQTSIAHLPREKFMGVPMPVPPVPEQRAIATALSDVDALLSALEQLLAKKRDLKQAAMQQLLTGQTRLPGFHGEWEFKALGDLADIRSGGTPSTAEPKFWDGEVLWCTPTDITALKGRRYLFETSRRITELGLKFSSAEKIPANSVVMTSRATIGDCAINTVPVSTNQGFKNFVPFHYVDVDFLYYLLTTQKQGFISLCGGSTFLEIGKGQLVTYEVRLPLDKGEQTAIAAVLSDMDAELEVLEQRLTKTRTLKQGMMQELLTGRTRLL